ncbi:sucrose phosphorylase [Microbacterium sp. BG28]|uniref:sucrose phosphorylase n=1 Tax=Microbacterium sp. BG28 TaxID=3097356 RepID=UPI002A59F077|nr:sucrose phosphorylase [Microbacterium sp. BG28]MDY0828506.1 sucrose phosphorylase [Microbacterium sp. BG28]
MKPVVNQAMLITYADSMGGDLPALQLILDAHFAGAFGGIHILPFFPSSGDRGFAVIEYDIVDPAFGDWDDIDALGRDYYLMADFMINHASIRSAEFLDYMQRGDESPYKSMFIDWNEFWGGGEPTEAEMAALYRRKQHGPYLDITRADGKVVRLWNTFFAEQVDIDPWQPVTQEYFARNLGRLADHVALIRFDAFAYAAKRPGTNCFFVEPEVWDVLEIGMAPIKDRGTQMLPEIHENYEIQLKMSAKGHWVYDFALPMLTLHTLFTGRTDRMRHWLEICPRKQFTTLDTHDGIGVVDVVGLLDDDEIDSIVDLVNARTEHLREILPLPASVIRRGDKGAQRYQLMSSFYSALGEDDAAFLLARVFQLFVPGIPQIYYVGALFGANDPEALAAAGDARAANRHDYTAAEIAERVQKREIQQLLDILRWRNTFPAFDGDFEVSDEAPGVLVLIWTDGDSSARLRADFLQHRFTITAARGAERPTIVFES